MKTCLSSVQILVTVLCTFFIFSVAFQHSHPETMSNFPVMYDKFKGLYTPCGLVSFIPPHLQKCDNFVVLFMGHSGSSALMEQLERHFHFFNPGFEPLYGLRPNASAAFLKAREYFEEGRAKHVTVGFKMRPWSILALKAEFKLLAAEYNVCVAQNFRLNMLESFITDMRERKFQTTQFDRRTQKNGLLNVTIEDAEKLKRNVADDFPTVYPGMAARVLTQNNVLLLPYENFLQNPKLIVAYVGSSFGLEPKAATETSQEAKFYKRSHSGVAANVDQESLRTLTNMFDGSPFKWMLHNYECSPASSVEH